MALGLSSSAIVTPFLNCLRGTVWTPVQTVAGVYIKLHLGDPGAAGLTAPSVGSTARVIAALAAPAGNAVALSGTQPSWTNGGATETLSHISVWESAAGAFLWSAVLTAPQAWSSGNTFAVVSLGVALAPVAA